MNQLAKFQSAAISMQELLRVFDNCSPGVEHVWEFTVMYNTGNTNKTGSVIWSGSMDNDKER